MPSGLDASALAAALLNSIIQPDAVCATGPLAVTCPLAVAKRKVGRRNLQESRGAPLHAML